MVGLEDELGDGAGGVGAETREERFDVGERFFFVLAAHEVPAFGGLGSGVGDKDGVDGGHVGGVFFGIGVGADEAFFFAAEEDEAHGATGWAAESLHGAGDFKDGRDAGAVVLSAGSGVPGVEVCAHDNDRVRVFATGNFGDHVINFSCGADAVREGEVDGDRAFCEEAFDEELVFESDLCDRHRG